MNRTPVRTLSVTGVALLAALSPAAAMAHPDSGAGSAPKASSALLVRSQALNQQLHLGSSTAASTQASRALLLRSDGLNRQLALGAGVNADLRSPDTRDAATLARGVPSIGISATSNDFDWDAAGIGAITAAMAGAIALTATAVVRRKPAGLWS
jgi:hypothetical protein